MACRINLHIVSNDDCVRNCNKDMRKQITENDLCTLVKSKQDELAVRCVGEWAEQKIYLLYQYFGIFAKGMKNKWKEINYIEICSGPGRCVVRENGVEIDGTSLAILNHDSAKYITKAYFFDYDENVVKILNERIKILKISDKKAKAYYGDYNEPSKICDKLCETLSSQYSLNLVVIDPTDCSVPFKLIEALTGRLKNIDFIINIATGTDFSRNIPMAFNDINRASKYERFIGSRGFFSDSKNILLNKSNNFAALRSNFISMYQENMKKLGYSIFRLSPIKHYYYILFSSKNKVAADFWDKAQKTEYDGQLTLY